MFTYRLAMVPIGDVALQHFHRSVQATVDGLVVILLVGGLDDQSDGTVNCSRVHVSY